MKWLKFILVFLIISISINILSDFNIPPFANEERRNITILIYCLTGMWVASHFSPFQIEITRASWRKKWKGIFQFIGFLLFLYFYSGISAQSLIEYGLSAIIFTLLFPVAPKDNSWRAAGDLFIIPFGFMSLAYIIKRGILDYFWQ